MNQHRLLPRKQLDQFHQKYDLQESLPPFEYGELYGYCDQIGMDEGGKTCGCLLCFEKGLESDRRIDDVGTSVDHLHTTDMDTLSVPLVGIEEDTQQDTVTLRNESSSSNPIGRAPAQVLMRPAQVSSNNRPRKRRAAEAGFPVEPVTNSEEIAEILGKAFLEDPSCESEAFKETLRKLQQFYISKPNVCSTSTSSPHNLRQYISPKPAQTRHEKSVVYHCTYPKCKRQPFVGRCAKSDWKRHEQTVHWNSQRWMCKQCNNNHALQEGGFVCNFCLEIFPHIQAIDQHTLQCEGARRLAKTFSRKDKLREHLRGHHALQAIGEDQLDWAYEVEGRWPRQCGFCGLTLNDWDCRADHIGNEFLKGAKISDWRIPFVPKSTDNKLPDFTQKPDDDDDDEDGDDDFHGSEGHGIEARFSARRIAPKPTGNWFTPSDTTWNYGAKSRNATESDDFDQFTQDDGYESEATSTTIVQPKIVAIFETTEPWIAACVPNYTISHGDFNSLKKASLEIVSSLTSSVPKQHQQRTFDESASSRQPISINKEHQSSSSRCGSDNFERNPQSLDSLHFPEINCKAESSFAAAARTSSAPKRTPAMYKLSPDGTSSYQVPDSILNLYLEREEPFSVFSAMAKALTTSPPPITQTVAAKAKLESQPPKTQRFAGKVARSTSDASTASSISSSAESTSTLEEAVSSISRQATSRATSISVRRWHPHPTFIHLFNLAPYNYGYDLPCEFFFLGCNLRFSPAHLETWISHSESHFADAPLPSTAICTFCDEGTFRNHSDVLANWRNRMLHIHEHLESFTPANYMRPDFWVIEHMRTYGLISPEDVLHAVKGTERPYCEDLYPLDYETPEGLRKKEKDLQQLLDLQRENRRLKQELRKGKIVRNTSHYYRPRETHDKLYPLVTRATPEVKFKNDISMLQSHYLKKMGTVWETKQKEKCIDKTQKDHCLECHLLGKCSERIEQSVCCLDCQVSAILHQIRDVIDCTSVVQYQGNISSISVGSDNSASCQQKAISRTQASSLVSSHSRASEVSQRSSFSSFSGPASPKIMIAGNAEAGKQKALPLKDESLTELSGSGSSSVIELSVQNSKSTLSESIPCFSDPAPKQFRGVSSDVRPRESFSAQELPRCPETKPSRKYSKETPKIIRSRGSRSSSCSSYDSRDSNEQKHYTSYRSTGVDYYRGSQSSVVEGPKERKYRDPTDDRKYVTSTSRGNVEVINHRMRIYDPEAPHSSDATYSHYTETRHRSSRHFSQSHRG